MEVTDHPLASIRHQMHTTIDGHRHDHGVHLVTIAAHDRTGRCVPKEDASAHHVAKLPRHLLALRQRRAIQEGGVRLGQRLKRRRFLVLHAMLKQRQQCHRPHEHEHADAAHQPDGEGSRAMRSEGHERVGYC